MNLTSLLQNLLAAAPLVGLLVLLRIVNVPKARRHQQFALPAIAVLFAVGALIVLYRFNDWFANFLGWVFSLMPFLQGLYQTRWLYIIENTAIVLAFFAVKYVYRAVAARLFSGERFPGSTLVDYVYEYDASSGRWYVRERLSQVRQLYRVLYWSSLVLAAGLVLAMNMMPSWAGFQELSFPAVAVLVLGEVLFAYDGITKQEESDSFTGERDLAARHTNYAALREVFRELFPQRVIDEGVDLAHGRGSASHTALAELAASDSGTDQLFAEFFERLKANGFDVDENLMHASLGMLAGRSVLINTPFYVDLTAYLALPAYVRLLKGGKVLVVSGRDSGAGDVARWMEEGFERISGVPELWTVRMLGLDVTDGLDIGVLRSADLHNLDILAANDEFFRAVEMVLVIEPSRMLATAQLGLGLLVSRLSAGKTPVYIALDRNHDGLVDALSHLLKVNITDVVATQPVLGASSEMVWKAEGPQMSADILPGVARYLGMGTELAAVALKYHVSEVGWVGGDRFPVTDMSWIAGQYFGPINSFAELEPSQTALNSALRPMPNPLHIDRVSRRFLVVEDEFCNVYESLRLFQSRSLESGFIHLISEDYLLRDYMVDNRELFSNDPKAIPAIVADFARTPRNTVLRLALMLSAFPVEESKIVRELELAGWEVDDDDPDSIDSPVVGMLSTLIGRYLDVADPVLQRVAGARARWRQDDPDVPVEPAYRLMAGTGLDRVVRELGSAYFLVEDEEEGRDFIGACLQGHVQQTVLPGQFLTVGGKYYEVLTVGQPDRPAEVVLRRAAEHISGRPVCRAVREFVIHEDRPAEHSAPRIEADDVTVDRRIVSMSVRTDGYLELPSRSDLAGVRRVSIDGLGKRSYSEKEALRISMPNASPAVRRTIAVLLNELFVTVFPAGHNFLAALADDPDGDVRDLLPGFAGGDGAIWIVEDSSVDLGLIIAVERNWRRLLEIVTDYLDWVQQAENESDADQNAVVAFPGETEADAAERIRRAETADDGDQRVSWWQRLVRRVKSWFVRAPRELPAAAPMAPVQPEQEAQPEPVAVPVQVVESEFEFVAAPEPALDDAAELGGEPEANEPELEESEQAGAEHEIEPTSDPEPAPDPGPAPTLDVDLEQIEKPDANRAPESEQKGADHEE